MDFGAITLSELLSHSDETISRNAMSILKCLKKIQRDALDKLMREREERRA